MTRRLYSFFLCAGLLTTVLIHPYSARATLGEPADSIEGDWSALAAVKTATRRSSRSPSGYTVEQSRVGLTTVRQYVSPSGVVFGVAWSGAQRPALDRLLGSYYGEYQDALRWGPRRQGRAPLSTVTGRLVLESWGHMRNLQGHAYLPSLIPNGVSADEIK